MTREEVVKWLESLKRETGKAENYALWHYAESIDMAIKALSPEDRPTGEWKVIVNFQSAKPPVLTCDGCRHVGTYDTDFPCSGCIRREKDYYE